MARRFESKTGRAAPAPSNLKSSRRCMGTSGENGSRGLIGLDAAVFDGHLAGGAQGPDGIAFRNELHSHIPIKAQLAELAENIRVVNLASAGVVAAGHVGHVDYAHLIEIFFELGEEVAFGDLIVKEIV